MKYKSILILLFLFGLGCGREPDKKGLSAQDVVDRAIEVAGGSRYRDSRINFDFRDRHYAKYREDRQRVLSRVTETDTAVITDILKGYSFERRVNDSVVFLPDSTSGRFARSVNSVHYFAYLPYGLNDRAVNKELLGRVELGDSEYYKIRVTFDQEGGGEDYQDVFIYWFNTKTFRPDYIAYTYHTDGGGQRFREAYNDREVGGIRFSDYRNYKSVEESPVTLLDSLFIRGELELLSVIELNNIVVTPDNYN